MEEYGFFNITKLMHCGVYALIKKEEVIYVGKSRQPLMRIHTHVKNRGRKLGTNLYGRNDTGPAVNGKGISFDTVWFLPCMLGQLYTLEVHFIKTFMPKYNVRHNPEAKPRPAKEPIVTIPIPDDIRAILKQMITITGLPPIEDRPKVYIRRLL